MSQVSSRSTAERLTIGCMVNDRDVLLTNLETSDCLQSGRIKLVVAEGAASAAIAANSLLSKADGDLVAIVHQDVHLPRGWDKRVLASAAALDEQGVRWGVLGVFGMTVRGTVAGQVWSNGLGQELRGTGSLPADAVSCDELVLIVKKSEDLQFDEQLPGFHFYGTDIVQAALARKLGAFVIDAPVIHNSLPVRNANRGYLNAYRFMVDKWRDNLPIPTCTTPLTASRWPLMRYRWRRAVRQWKRLNQNLTRYPRPDQLAQDLEYE